MASVFTLEGPNLQRQSPCPPGYQKAVGGNCRQIELLRGPALPELLQGPAQWPQLLEGSEFGNQAQWPQLLEGPSLPNLLGDTRAPLPPPPIIRDHRKAAQKAAHLKYCAARKLQYEQQCPPSVVSMGGIGAVYCKSLKVRYAQECSGSTIPTIPLHGSSLPDLLGVPSTLQLLGIPPALGSILGFAAAAAVGVGLGIGAIWVQKRFKKAGGVAGVLGFSPKKRKRKRKRKSAASLGWARPKRRLHSSGRSIGPQ